MDFKDLVKLTPGYVGADVSTLCKEASIIAVERIISDEGREENPQCEGENIFIDIEDFTKAAKRVQPSA
jgi:SpoVK/Ycf46/Vps4 family AAA+-type ATPase